MVELVAPAFLAPLLLGAAAIVAALRPGRRPAGLPRLAEMAAFGALLLALANVPVLVRGGPMTLALGDGPLLLALRLDVVSATMALLVAFVGWVVVR